MSSLLAVCGVCADRLSPQTPNGIFIKETRFLSCVSYLIVIPHTSTPRSPIHCGETLQAAHAAMNLSPELETKLKAAIESARSQAESLITPEQRRQIFQLMRALPM